MSCKCGFFQISYRLHIVSLAIFQKMLAMVEAGRQTYFSIPRPMPGEDSGFVIVGNLTIGLRIRNGGHGCNANKVRLFLQGERGKLIAVKVDQEGGASVLPIRLSQRVDEGEFSYAQLHVGEQILLGDETGEVATQIAYLGMANGEAHFDITHPEDSTIYEAATSEKRWEYIIKTRQRRLASV